MYLNQLRYYSSTLNSPYPIRGRSARRMLADMDATSGYLADQVRRYRDPQLNRTVDACLREVKIRSHECVYLRLSHSRYVDDINCINYALNCIQHALFSRGLV